MLSSTPIILKIGRHLIDLLHPLPDMIDLDAIEDALWSVRRWSGNPKALTLRQHTTLVQSLAKLLGADQPVIEWCWHHDDHEAIIGDIPGPLKHWLNVALVQAGTTTLDQIEQRLDAAICAARGIILPTDAIRRDTHFYDKLAETLEWRFVLGEPMAVWNMPFENWLTEDQAKSLIEDARSAVKVC